MVAVLACGWEVRDRLIDGHWSHIGEPDFDAAVRQSLEQAVQVAGSSGADVALLTAPCFDSGEQPSGLPWPEDDPARLARYNELVRQVAAEHPAVDVDNLAGGRRLRRKPFDNVAVAASRHETDVLAIGLVGDGESEAAGVFAHLRLAHFAERKAQQPQLLARRGEEEIALVAVRVDRAVERAFPANGAGGDIMAGRQRIGAEVTRHYGDGQRLHAVPIDDPGDAAGDPEPSRGARPGRSSELRDQLDFCHCSLALTY